MTDYNAPGKRCIFGEKAKRTTIRLYSWEVEPVKKFIKELRKQKLKELKEPDT